MDEIGVMVTHITQNGFLRFTKIGGVQEQFLLGSRVQFANGTVGVVYSEKQDSKFKLHPMEKYYIDVCATGNDDVPVEVGTPGVFLNPFINNESRYIGKSLDDRLGCAILIETARRLESSPHEIYLVFSSQEEVGTRGASTAANILQPDVGLAVDVTWAGDTPNSVQAATKLGSGPGIKVKDSGMIAHSGLVRHMRSTAEKAEIAYQMEVLVGGTTDARSMQIAGAGCAAGCISIPTRYVHSQSEVAAASDVEDAVLLLLEILSHQIVL
jgi:endoglucanase